MIDEQLDTIGKAFLGLTRRLRPLPRPQVRPDPARDYYALAGIFDSTQTIHGHLLNRQDLTGWNLHPLGPDGQKAYEACQALREEARRPLKEQTELKPSARLRRAGGSQPTAKSGRERSRRRCRSRSRIRQARGAARRREAGARAR